MKDAPANGTRKSPRELLTTENATLKRLFEADAQLPEMRAALPGRTDTQIRRHLHHLELKREAPLSMRNSWVWGEIQEAIREHGPMTAAELEERTDSAHGAVLRQIKQFHGKGLYIAAWRPTSRKPAAVWALGNEPDADKRAALTRQPAARRARGNCRNPFAVAAGLVRAPTAGIGRIFTLHDDEQEAA